MLPLSPTTLRTTASDEGRYTGRGSPKSSATAARHKQAELSMASFSATRSAPLMRPRARGGLVLREDSARWPILPDSAARECRRPLAFGQVLSSRARCGELARGDPGNDVLPRADKSGLDTNESTRDNANWGCWHIVNSPYSGRMAIDTSGVDVEEDAAGRTKRGEEA